jgi:predicted ATPase
MLLDRRSEREVLDRLLEAVRAGQSRVLVVRGEPGVGKSALLEYVVEQASDVAGGGEDLAKVGLAVGGETGGAQRLEGEGLVVEQELHG